MVQQKEPNSHDKQLVTLGRTLQTLREEEDAEVLIETVIRYLETEFGYSVIWIGLYDRVGHRIVGKGGVVPNGDLTLLKQRLVLNPGDTLEQVVIQQRPVAVPDLREELRMGEWRKVARQFNVQGTVIFPIRYRDRCYGVTLLGTTLWGASPQSEEKARLSIVLGELAAALSRIEVEWQRQQLKRPDQAWLALLSQLRSQPGLGARLSAVVEETHQFIQPARTNIYWFERERRYFWRRLGNSQRTTGFNEPSPPASGITVQEVSGFYQALLADQLVSIGEAHSSLKADTTSRLMQQIRARSLLAAPILFQNELLGFLAVEGTEPRIWTEEEKSFVRGAAQLVALTAPLSEMESTIDQVKQDRLLTTEITRSIYGDDDWKSTLKTAGEVVCRRLRADRFLVLRYDPEQDAYEICYQSQPGSRRPMLSPLAGLPQPDQSLLEKSQAAIGIENLDGDLRLLPWRDRLLEMGVRSLICCNSAIGHPPDGIILIAHETARTWNAVERDLVRVVSQQIGVILHQWQLQMQLEQQQRVNQTIQWGVTALQQTHQPEKLERSALQHLSQVLQAPLAALVTWVPGRSAGRLLTSSGASDRFTLNTDMVIPVQTDPLLHWAVESCDVLSLAIGDVPADSRHWLSGVGIGQVLALVLQTAPDHEPTGVALVVDSSDRHWSAWQVNAFRTLVSQLAWSRRYLLLTDSLTAEQINLEQLNWYKQRSLEEVYRSMHTNLQRLQDLGNPKDPLFVTRRQQILRQMSDRLMPIAHLTQTEHWQIHPHAQGKISLISLLKHALERVDSVIKQRQLWSQVHNEANLTIGGDVFKMELVLYELLLAACERSPSGNRIDLWCRQIDTRWLELSITDSGEIDPRLLSDLEAPDRDRLAPSTLNQPPGLHLRICQVLMQQLGGECNLYKLDDGRTLSRLVLPLIAPSPS